MGVELHLPVQHRRLASVHLSPRLARNLNIVASSSGIVTVFTCTSKNNLANAIAAAASSGVHRVQAA